MRFQFLACMFLVVVTLLTAETIANDDDELIHAELQAVHRIEEFIDEFDGENSEDEDLEDNNSEFDMNNLKKNEEYEDDDDDDQEEDNDDDDDQEEDNDDDEDVEDVMKTVEPIDPCADMSCGYGEECIVDEGNALCRCKISCPVADDEEKVCSSDNVTYASKCDLFRTKCVYLRDRVKGAKHFRLRYYGPCKDLGKCDKTEFSDFPSRFRSWIKNVYLQLYDEDVSVGGLDVNQKNPGRLLAANRQRLSEFEQDTFEAMERDLSEYLHLYRYPVYWKFKTLDVDPTDNYLSKSELEPLVASLIPLERCSRAFFKKADLNKDKQISLHEWGLAFGFTEDNMDSNADV